MAYPGSNITFNLYDADPPAYPVGLARSKTTARSDAKDVLRPKSPMSMANAVLPPTTTGSGSGRAGSTGNDGSSTPTAGAGGAGTGAGGTGNLKKSQSMRVSSRTPAPLAIPSPSRDDSFSSRTGYSSGSASAHPGSMTRAAPLSASATSSGSQSAGGLLGSSNPFNDLSSSLQIPSFRPNLSKMGRKLSEFGKEVFSLEEEPDVISRARTPGIGAGSAAAAALGAEKRQGGSEVSNSSKVQAPPLLRSGTAPAPSSITSVRPGVGAVGAASTASFVAPMAGLTNAPTLSTSSALPSPAVRSLSSSAMTTSASQPLPGTSASRNNHSHNHTHNRPAPIPEDVPGMGDEPIMCPFCDKPLPPPLIISQLAHLHAAKERGKRASEVTLVDKTVQADKTRGSVDSIVAKPQQPAVSSSSEKLKAEDKEEKEEKVSAESFLPVVKQSEEAEKAANAPGGVITEQEIAEWIRRAGLTLASGSSTEGSATAVSGAPSADHSSSSSTAAKDPAASGTKPPSLKSATVPSKAFPLLPPPPPPASRLKSPSATNTTTTGSESVPTAPTATAEAAKKTDTRRGSRFGGLFGGKGKDSKDDADEEDESDDDYAQGGYAKLSGPASPERVENRELELEERRRSPVGVEDSAGEGGGVGGEVKDGESEAGGSKEPATQAAKGDTIESTEEPIEKVSSSKTAGNKGDGAADGQDEVKKVLQEVLTKLNVMTKSHNDLASSHNNLLTSLKIARSNLVMAEANAEMLEEQLRKAQIHHPVATRPSVTSTTSRPSVDAGRRSLEEGRKVSNPAVAPSNPSKARPNSLIIPASALFETGPMTGPASSQAGSRAANNQNASGVFGGFFGGKSLHIPTAKELQASAARLGDTLAGPSRPQTPISGALTVAGSGGLSGMGYAHAHGSSQLLRGETPTVSYAAGGQSAGAGSAAMRETGSSPAQFFDYHMPSPPTSHLPSPNPDHKAGSGHGVSPSGQPAQLARPALSPAHSGQFATEFAKLRTAYASSQNKMEAMAKELSDLKKGKIEMEAELETLSQALFEEANKMVADERRKRLESEEQLKEVREEKEVLKETIKVLGGKDKAVPEVTVSGDADGDEDEEERPKQKEKVMTKEKAREHKEDNLDIDDEAWKPRDLDKHYEALRKTIHHVADGASPGTAVLGGDASVLADAVNYTGARREFEAALDEVQAAAEAEGVMGFTPIAVNPVLELSPVLPKHDTATGAEINPWAEVDFSGANSGSDQTPRKGSQHGYGVDPLEGRRESLGLNLVGVDFGEGLDGLSSGRSSLSRQGRVEQEEEEEPEAKAQGQMQGKVQDEDARRGSVRMRRSSSA